jgi:uncharacterized protein (TIGR02996 family)
VVIDRVRFEKASSFVELWREPRTLVRAFGPVNGEGHSRVEAFPDEERAKLAYARQVLRLEGKGYRSGAYNAPLMAAIKSNPADPAAYLVYADWLLDQGDARGELIMRMHKREVFQDLLEEHPVQLEPAWWQAQGVSVAWRLGFAQRLSIKFCADAGVIRRVLRHPSLEVLEELELEKVTRYSFGLRQLEEALLELPDTVTRVSVPAELKQSLKNKVTKAVFA